MPSKRDNKGAGATSEPGQYFTYWVDVRDLRDGSARALRLRTVVRIHIPTKKNEPQRPGEEFLQLEDGAAMLEAKTLDDLVVQLRGKYPDEAYERTLRRERDFRAEHAMNELVELLAGAEGPQPVFRRHD